MHLSGISLIDTGQALDNRRFSRAIFTHEGVYFSFSERQLRIVERDDSRKGLRDVLHGNENMFFLCHICLLYSRYDDKDNVTIQHPDSEHFAFFAAE